MTEPTQAIAREFCPYLACQTEYAEPLCELLSVLPPAIRDSIDRNTQWNLSHTFPFVALFNAPRNFVGDNQHLDHAGTFDLIEFYQAVATYLAQPYRRYGDFDEETFVREFAEAAKRRFEGDLGYIPTAFDPNPTATLVEILWSTSNEEWDTDRLWREAVKTARLRDPSRLVQRGGSIIDSPVGLVADSVSHQAMRLMGEENLEASLTVRGAVNTETGTGSTNFRLQGLWKRLSFANSDNNARVAVRFDPVNALEVRTGDADILILGGLQTQIVGEPRQRRFFRQREDAGDVELYLVTQGGFSARNALFHHDFEPGAELALSLSQIISGDSYWDVAATLRYGLSMRDANEALAAGITARVVM